MRKVFVFITAVFLLSGLAMMSSLAGEQKTNTGWYWPAGSGEPGFCDGWRCRGWLEYYVDEKLLFSVDLRFQSDLDSNNISGNLRQEFENNGISLSSNATALIEEIDTRWLVIDGTDTYIVKKGANELNIYMEQYQYHLAQDFARDADLPVYALADGEVVIARTDVSGYGPGRTSGGALIARFQTSDSSYFLALYGHLDNLHSPGSVYAGEVLGYCNDYDPPHLHFGIHPGYDLPSNPWLGYTTDENNTYGWVNPVDFLLDHSVLPATAPIFVDDDNTTGSWNGTQEHPYQYIQDGTDAAVDGDTVFVFDGVYVIGENINVPQGVILAMSPGTIVKFNGAYDLWIEGTLKAEGTLALPIVFTSFKDDSYGGDTNNDGSTLTLSH